MKINDNNIIRLPWSIVKCQAEGNKNKTMGLFWETARNYISYDTVSDHLESLSTSVPEILTADRLNGQCSGLYG